jgi:hypothetical protein
VENILDHEFIGSNLIYCYYYYYYYYFVFFVSKVRLGLGGQLRTSMKLCNSWRTGGGPNIGQFNL